jgi:hypothetical protein
VTSIGLRRREFLQAAGLAVVAPAAARAGLTAAAPELLDLRVSNGSRPFAGDHRLLSTVSAGGSGLRDRAIVSFRLRRPAGVTMEAVRTGTIRIGRPADEVIWAVARTLPPGRHELVWTPRREVQPRTYILRLTVFDRLGHARLYGRFRPGRLAAVDAPVVRVQGVDVATVRSSYAPGEPADLLIAADASELRVQVFHYGGRAPAVDRDLKTNGLAVTPPVQVDWRAHRDAPSRLRVLRAGAWESGLYFVRVGTDDGRVGYAPFILRPRRLGTRRVAVVLATHTWQAYNFYDADGDGWGDSWYVSDAIRSVDVTRPYLDFGVPFRFRDWDLTFIAWLNRTGKRVDYLSDDDLEATGSGERLRAAYDLIVFPGHEEYVTTRTYDMVVRYRDLGGNLLFLSANNFFRRVRRDGRRLVRDRLWRERGRPEAALVGVQYVGSDNGQRQGGYVASDTEAAGWVFEGTGLTAGATFGRYGIEIDARAVASPPGTQVVARIADLMGAGRSAEMTYYETAAGARVFAAGALNFAASLDAPEISRLVDNVWARLSKR